ncbi:MAG: DJ-1/PfpI family protein, partial [Chloroflexi bacterium]|nr:DJ-1/PfpI family protein [Chloroflexota bacterium]
AAELTTTFCNGSHLLAVSGVLDGRTATTNKMLFSQIAADQPNVNWVAEARWVDDGDIVTGSGVSAGIDMALYVIARLFGDETAERLAQVTEYEWHRDPAWDPFAAKAGLP